MNPATLANAACATTEGGVADTLRTVLRNLYRVPHPDETDIFAEAESDIRRNTLYLRARPWIVDHRLERQTIVAVKLIHTVIFGIMMGFVLFVTYSGLRNRFTRATGVSLAAVVVEAIVVTTNQGRCPLTIVVEDLGATHGSVSDIFLPGWFARHIPHISSALIGVGLVALGLRRTIGR
jgi:hypothetical protein